MFLTNIHQVFPTEVNCLIIAFKIAYISWIVSRETFKICVTKVTGAPYEFSKFRDPRREKIKT